MLCTQSIFQLTISIKFGMFLYGIQRSTELREKLESLPRPQTPTIRQGLEYKWGKQRLWLALFIKAV